MVIQVPLCHHLCTEGMFLLDFFFFVVDLIFVSLLSTWNWFEAGLVNRGL